MKIRFAIVGSDLLALVRAEIDVLLSAVNAGDMDGVDAATALLLKLTADCSSIDLFEDEWRKFLNKIRLKNPEFKSNYLLPGVFAPLYFQKLQLELCSRTSSRWGYGRGGI